MTDGDLRRIPNDNKGSFSKLKDILLESRIQIIFN